MLRAAAGRARSGWVSSEAIERENRDTRDAWPVFRTPGRTCFFEGGAVSGRDTRDAWPVRELLIEACLAVHRHTQVIHRSIPL